MLQNIDCDCVLKTHRNGMYEIYQTNKTGNYVNIKLGNNSIRIKINVTKSWIVWNEELQFKWSK